MRVDSKMFVYLVCAGMAACARIYATGIYVVPPAEGHVPDAVAFFNTWTNAATNLHDAIAAVGDGRTNIFVSNGVYAVTNGVGIPVTNAVYIRSWNEGELDQTNTVITGEGVSRGLLMSNAAAVVDGFMISNCYRAGANATNNGAGILIYSGTVRHCDIVSNLQGESSTTVSYGGGGIAVGAGGANVVMENTVVRNNGVNARGGGLIAVNAADIALADCVIADNYAAHFGGGMYFTNCSGISIVNAGILLNSNGNHGAGLMFNTSTGIVVEGCVISGNISRVSAGLGAGINVQISTNVSISNCVVAGNTASGGSGIRSLNSVGLTIHGCRITDNVSTQSSTAYGGAVMLNAGTLRNCLVVNNTGTNYGGGVFIPASSVNTKIESCTIISNRTGGNTGGGVCIYSPNTTVEMINNIVYLNSAGAAGGGAYSNYGYNTTVYGLWTNNCVLQGALDFNGTGTNNIAANPLLADPVSGNFRLRAGSPCVNAGTNQDWMAGAADLDGADRLVYTNAEGVLTVDMGCYEYPVPQMTAAPLSFACTNMRGTISVMPVELQLAGAITNYVDTPWAVNITSAWIWAGVKRGMIPASAAFTAMTNVTDDLPAGVYNASAVYAVTNRFLPFAQLSSQVVDVALNVMELTASSLTLSNTVMVGSTAPTQSFNVVSAGAGRLDYTIVTNGGAAWLAVSPGANTLLNNATNAIKLTYDTALLAPGLHTASLRLATTNHGGATQTVAIAMEVLELSLTPGALTNQALAGFAAPPQSLVVRNLGAGSFDYTLATNAAWLSVTPAAGTATGAGTTHVVAYVSAALAPGAHAGAITLASSNHGGITQTVAAALNVMSLERAPSSLAQTTERGTDPDAAEFEVWNSGGGALHFTVASDTAWVGAGTTSGVAGAGSVTVAVDFVNTRNFAEGSYTGRITVSASDGWVGVATQTVAVTLNVLAKVPDQFTAGDGVRLDGVLMQWTDTLAQDYEVWRARAADFSDGALLARAGAGNEYLDTTALYGELYYYRVRPENLLGGYGRYSPSDTGWRGLAAPTNLAASQGQYTNRVRVSWSPVPNAQRYEVWRADLNSPGAAVRVTTPDVETTEYDDFSGVQDVIYYYWAKAKTEYTSGFSDSAEGYKSALPPPAAVAASAGTHTNKVRLTWDGVSGALEYEIWRAGSAAGVPALLALSGALGYDDFDVTQGAVYYYSVRACNRQSRSGLSATAAGFSDVGRAGLDLSALTFTPTLIRAGGAPHVMRINVRNLGPRIMSSPDGWLKFDLILSPTTNIADGTVAWSGAKYVAATVGGDVNVDFADAIAGVPPPKMQIPARYRGVYHLFLRVAHTPPSTLTGADAGQNVLMCACPVEIRRGMARDCTGDWRSDLLIYDTMSGQWGVKPVAGGQGVVYDLGLPGGAGVAGDYDGDGLADAVMFGAGAWSARLSDNGQSAGGIFGAPGFQAVGGDYDGDGVSDPAVYCQSDGMWYVRLPGGTTAGRFGGPGFQAVAGDFDGDGASDPALYRETDGMWQAWLSADGGSMISGRFGGPGWQPLTGDFDGDGISDAVIYNAADGAWRIYLVGTGEMLRGNFGGSLHAPVTGDFDGDGLWDVGLCRMNDGYWFLARIDGAVILWNWQWGGAGWLPLQ